jgi:hypothetical protein
MLDRDRCVIECGRDATLRREHCVTGRQHEIAGDELIRVNPERMLPHHGSDGICTGDAKR